MSYKKKTIDNHPNIKDNLLNVPVLYNSNIKVYFYESLFKNVVKAVKDFLESCDLLVFDVFKRIQNFNGTCVCIMQ